MKKFILLSPVILLLFGFTAGHSADDKLSSLVLQFKTSEETAKSAVFNGVTGGSYFIPNVKILKTLSTEEKISLIQSLGDTIKKYLTSKEFIEKYNQYREDKKPIAPEPPKYSSQLEDEQRENLKKSIDEIEKNKINVNKEQREMFDTIINQFNQQIQEIDNRKNTKHTSEMDVYIKQSYDMQMNEHQKNMAAWESTYPMNDPSPMIKNWIKVFLEKSSEINFDAETTITQDGIVKFVDQKHEHKDNQWKLYFRAGKETVSAARTYAQDWLDELQ